MTWHKHFKSVNSVLPSSERTVSSSASISKYSNWLPEVYSGPPDRLQRYGVYDQMQLDHEIASALDTIADFGTAMDEVTQLPLVLKFDDVPTPTEMQILEKTLRQWCRLNELNQRMWGMFRSVLIYGDQFFIRDPDTFKMYWIDPAKVEKVIVNESEGKRIESYYVKDIDLNMKSLVATNQLNRHSSAAFGSNSIVFSPPLQGNVNYVSGGYGSAGTANYNDNGAVSVDAQHMVQISLTNGMNSAWPFGLSILEPIYKVYKQKGLIEDAILIYRIHRAPERRVFFIDVGTTPPNKAQQFLERVRYEVQQKRIPSRTGGACLAMDTEVPLLDGRVLTIRDLAAEYESGKENWAYSCDPITGETAPGLITWAGVTQESAKVVRLTLDNGEQITCTPDHKFPIIGKGFVEAKDIVANNDSLFSFNERLVPINGEKGNTYHQVYDHRTNQWEFTHRVVGRFMKSRGAHQEHTYDCEYSKGGKGVIHHMDFNRYNNNPENLFYMGWADHIKLHANQYSEYYKTLSEETKMGIRRKMSIGSLASWAKLRETDMAEYGRRIAARVARIQAHAVPIKNQRNQFNDYMFSVVCKVVDSGITDVEEALSLLSANPEFMKAYADMNSCVAPGMVSKLVFDKFTLTTLRALLKSYGYSKWRNFLKSRGTHIHRPSRKLVWHPMMLKILVDTVASKNITMKTDAHRAMVNHSEFMRLFGEANTAVKGNATPDKFTGNTFHVFITDHGYDSWTDLKGKVKVFNHKVVAVEYLEDEMQVGTLTIDGDELYHNHHTFAIKQGVYTKNSNVVDATYNPMCLSMDTRVPLLDCRNLTIRELAQEYESGKINWAYSADPHTGKLAPGMITWAGVTRIDTQVLEVHLSNGRIITCTPDHKIPVWHRGHVEAQYLKAGDPLISHKSRGCPALYGDGQVYDHSKRAWVKRDVMMRCFFDGSYDSVMGDADHSDYAVTVTLLKWLDTTEDVGTITIDAKEQWHAHHTFAIDAGVFVKNSILEDYFFAVGADGRGSKVDVLPSGSGLSEIDDLRYFNNKMLRALGVPSSYLPTGPEDGTSSVSDGRVGSAFIQEFRFSKVVKRHQTQMIQTLDKEFKLFLKHKGLTIDSSLFELQFTAPQSFSEYRQLELDSAKINTFGALTDIPYVSKRFILKRYLGWTEGELAENERMWKEERSRLTTTTTATAAGMAAPAANLSDVGITTSGIDSMGSEGQVDDEDMGVSPPDDMAAPPPTPQQ